MGQWTGELGTFPLPGRERERVREREKERKIDINVFIRLYVYIYIYIYVYIHGPSPVTSFLGGLELLAIELVLTIKDDRCAFLFAVRGLSMALSNTVLSKSP